MEDVRSYPERLVVRPITLAKANDYVRSIHRHHGPAQGCVFCLQVQDETGRTRGVAIIGRPVARHLDDGLCAEVTRLATDGCPNACSKLYAAARRAVTAIGYVRLYTYILDDEPGSSLRAAGFTDEGLTGRNSWVRPNRKRTDKIPVAPRRRWSAACAPPGD